MLVVRLAIGLEMSYASLCMGNSVAVLWRRTGGGPAEVSGDDLMALSGT